MITKVFKNGNSKAIRIPKNFIDDNVELVEIKKEGNKIVIIPKKNSLDELFELIEKNKEITKDFLDDRNQPLTPSKEIF
jgi:virulence-associated protein VagC